MRVKEQPPLFDEHAGRCGPHWDGEGPMPLWMFPDHHREEIERLADGPEPPPKWLDNDLFRIVSRAWWEWHWRRGLRLERKAWKRESIPIGVRRAVLMRDSCVCQLCGLDVDPEDVHLDHIVPVSRGGRSTLANLQVTHSLCNLRKGARLMEELA